MVPGSGPAQGWELVIPNPALKLMDQGREVLRVKHYSLRTEQACRDWIRRYVRFRGVRSGDDLSDGGATEAAGGQLEVGGSAFDVRSSSCGDRRISGRFRSC
jgi:hypothetical protein